MTRGATSLTAGRRGRRRLPVIVALAIVAGVLAGNVLLSSHRVSVTSLMLAAPLLCGLTASVAETWAVSAVAITVAASVFVWDSELGSWKSWVPLVVVTLASGLAGVTALYRRRLDRDARRMRVLADLAVVAAGGGTSAQTARAVCDLLVPRLVDLCAIDLLGADGRQRRIAVAVADDPDAAELLGRATADPSFAGAGRPPAQVLHHPRLEAGTRGVLGRDEREGARLEALRVESAVVVPLAPRGSAVGALTLGTRSPRPRLDSTDDVEYVVTLAGRVALALDNAELSAELSSTEQQLEVILASVDAGVTVRDRSGRMIYANQAAADLLKLPDPAAVLAAAPGELMGRFDVYTEAGEPLALTDMGGTRLLTGQPAATAVTVRNVVRATGEERWLLNKAQAVIGPDGGVELAVNLIEDVTEVKRNEIAQRLLARTARTMAEAPDLESTLQAMADAAVPGLADWAGVDLLESSGRIRPFAVAHRDPEKAALGWRLRTRWPGDPDRGGGAAAVIRTGQPELMRDIPDTALVAAAHDPEHLEVLRAVGLNSLMIAPIRSGERILGALSFASSTSRRFDDRDLELACDLGRQVGIVVESAELHAAQTHIAQTLQAGLVPRELPALDGWQLSSAYRAAGRANEVGGDFYDIVSYPGGWMAVIGDVVGKGAEAAALTALARHTLAAIVESTGDVGEALRVLNRRLRQRGGTGDYRSLCTVCAIQVPDDGPPTIFSAGHPLPVLHAGGLARPVGMPSPMLGFLDEVPIAATPVQLGPGDRIVLYTDGVLDAIGIDERFGERRLLETVQRLADGATIATDVLGTIDAFVGSDQVDDIAILSLTRSVPAQLAPSAAAKTAPGAA